MNETIDSHYPCSIMKNVNIIEMNNTIVKLRFEKADLIEQLSISNNNLKRAFSSHRSLEDELVKCKRQLENTLRDYRETMNERSVVLEENNRLSEEKEELQERLKQFSTIIQKLINWKIDPIIKGGNDRNNSFQNAGKMKEEFNRICCNTKEMPNSSIALLESVVMNHDNDENEENEPILDMWHTKTIQISLNSIGQSASIVLGGGRGDAISDEIIPLFVRDVLPGYPFDGHIKKLDHILYVNDIDVSTMDQNSVREILNNSRNLKMVIKRRDSSCRIEEVKLSRNAVELGAEFEDGVFISKLHENGSGVECGLSVGNRIIHVNNIPVYSAQQTENLIQRHENDLVIGVATEQLSKECSPCKAQKVTPKALVEPKQRSRFLSKVHEKLFGRSTSEKVRPVIAQANLDAYSGDLMSCRHGSLRIPSSRMNCINHTLVRTGSLRAASYTADQQVINTQLDKFFHRPSYSNDENHHRYHCRAVGTNVDKSDLQKNNEYGFKKTSRTITPVDESTLKADQIQKVELGCRYSPNIIETQMMNVPMSTNSGLTSSINISVSSLNTSNSSPTKPYKTTPSNFSNIKPIGVYNTKPLQLARNQHISSNSPSLPEPPPYPGRRSSGNLSADSSNHLLMLSSSTSFQQNSLPSKTALKGSDSQILDVVRADNRMTRDVNGWSGPTFDLYLKGETNIRNNKRLMLEDLTESFYANDMKQIARINTRLSAVPTMNYRRVSRRHLKICGGNAIGILVEASIGEVMLGERILEIENINVRKATIEEATYVLDQIHHEYINLITEYDGGKRLEEVKRGSDCDGFFMRVNIDRSGENGDELDLKKGDILYVDNTLFMGVRGRWRAWRLDQEGRQRQCGIIPSQRRAEDEWNRARRAKDKTIADMRPRLIYERVERLNSSAKRPVVLVSAYVAPFMQTLIEEYGNRFAQCVAECRAPTSRCNSPSDDMGMYIEVRKREELFEMISINAMKRIVDEGYHCVLDLTPQAILKLHNMRFFPIVIRIKFKSAKQLKELSEHAGLERISSKTARELLERAQAFDAHLQKIDCTVNTISVGAQNGRNVIRYICQQIVAIAEHEQKRTVWIPAVQEPI